MTLYLSALLILSLSACVLLTAGLIHWIRKATKWKDRYNVEKVRADSHRDNVVNAHCEINRLVKKYNELKADNEAAVKLMEAKEWPSVIGDF